MAIIVTRMLQAFINPCRVMEVLWFETITDAGLCRRMGQIPGGRVDEKVEVGEYRLCHATEPIMSGLA